MLCCTLLLTLESLLSSDMLEEDSGLPGEDRSTCNGPSFSTLTSDGVCKGGALENSAIKIVFYIIYKTTIMTKVCKNIKKVHLPLFLPSVLSCDRLLVLCKSPVQKSWPAH